MNRYVILEHDWPETHWDFMLEWHGALRTWKLQRPPDSGGSIAAHLLGDHRIAYLDYEGPLSGNRGRVVRWDRGTYELLSQEPDRVVVTLRGARWSGRARLTRQASSDRWSCRFLQADAGT